MTQKTKLSYVDIFLGQRNETLLQCRIFNAITVTGCLLSVIESITNLIFKNTLNAFVILTVAIFAGLIYLYSRKTGNYRQFIVPVSIMFLALCVFIWITGGGTYSSAGYDFIALAACSGMIFDRRYRTFFILLLFTVIVGLLIFEYVNPPIIPIVSRMRRLADFSTSIILILLFIVSIVFFVIEQHRQDKV